jgi:hypothetical protein
MSEDLFRRERGRTTVLLAVIVAFGAIVGFTVLKQHQRRIQVELQTRAEEEEARKKAVERAQALASFKDDSTQQLFTMATAATEQLDATPTLHGKLVLLKKDDSGRGEVDSMQLDLEKPHVATRPEEVGTVILIERGKQVAGKYEKTGSTAYQRTCDLTLVDVARKVVVARKHFTGDKPDASIAVTGNHDVYGPDLSTTIIIWIDSLPLK